MGEVHCSFDVGDMDGARYEALEGLVDTGATYTWVPRDVLNRLGGAPEEQRAFVLADGREIDYDVAWVRVRLDGKSQPSLCVFGDSGTQPLLGVFTLEAFGLSVDPVNRRLVPTKAHLAHIRSERKRSGS